MARRFETVTETKKCEKLVETTCDLCGKKADRGEWESAMYKVGESEISVTVKQREGDSFPGGGSGTSYEVDMCPDCFRNRLIPWLKSQGAKIKEAEWDW